MFSGLIIILGVEITSALRGTVSFAAFLASLNKVRAASNLPFPDPLNWMEVLIPCPAGILAGKFKDKENKEELIVALEMVAVSFPPFMKVTGRTLESPLESFPKSISVGLAAINPPLGGSLVSAW